MSSLPQKFDSAEFLRTLTTQPGVYRMLDQSGDVIYVGKAKNLKKRVSSYFKKELDSPKTQVLVKQICEIEVTVTHTETEALILEHNTIKSLRPRYNVLLRDDKSFPYVYISDDTFPRVSLHRGSRQRKGYYFGPYPNSYAARESVNLIQKLFLLRQCENSYFRNRSRPCLQYQIKRCTAPCTDLISEQEYGEDVQNAVMFYQGKNTELINLLVKKMEEAAETLGFERAAKYRDQIANMRLVVESQSAEGANIHADFVVIVREQALICVSVLSVRSGKVQGNKTYFPKVREYDDDTEIMYAFITQFYLGGREIPSEVIMNTDLAEQLEVLADLLTTQRERNVRVAHQVRSDRNRWLTLAETNAINAINARSQSQEQQSARWMELKQVLARDEMPTRIECFDISHTLGEATMASCVVFNQAGPLKSAYRKYHIKDIEPGDDYAAMEQVLTRRFSKQVGTETLPDILVIDGGPGQLSRAISVIDRLGLSSIYVISVVKGEGRNPDYDRILTMDANEPLTLSTRSPAKHLLQAIRDEAHRFAISGHRKARDKTRSKSALDAIPGIGPKKRKYLLTQFGGLESIKSASLEDLKKVKGINAKLAEDLYHYLHHNGN
ncbi:MAG: excinuclease ABC subunit UvrC [Pseudomonadota bacterium]